MRKSVLLGAVIAVAALLPLSSAVAKVVAKVDVSSQTMNVYVDGSLAYSWPVSTARAGFHTPRGSYGVQSLQAMHYSKKYHNSPMPHSVFFKGGFAVHGTGAVGQLGRPASHGCVRLAPGHAAELYSLIQEHGRGGARIVVQN
jgi:lipoprotein-anchoring transpeptidase ErfK/SrfK